MSIYRNAFFGLRSSSVSALRVALIGTTAVMSLAEARAEGAHPPTKKVRTETTKADPAKAEADQSNGPSTSVAVIGETEVTSVGTVNPVVGAFVQRNFSKGGSLEFRATAIDDLMPETGRRIHPNEARLTLNSRPTTIGKVKVVGSGNFTQFRFEGYQNWGAGIGVEVGDREKFAVKGSPMIGFTRIGEQREMLVGYQLGATGLIGKKVEWNLDHVAGNVGAAGKIGFSRGEIAVPVGHRGITLSGAVEKRDEYVPASEAPIMASEVIGEVTNERGEHGNEPIHLMLYTVGAKIPLGFGKKHETSTLRP